MVLRVREDNKKAPDAYDDQGYQEPVAAYDQASAS
jgi:hypothetical protein